MPHKAHSPVGVLARSRSPKIEPHSDFGPPSSPHHKSSPGGVNIKSEHDISDDRYPSSSQTYIKSEYDMSDGRYPSPNGSFIKSEHDLSYGNDSPPSQPFIKLEHNMSDGHSLSPSESFIKFEHNMSEDHKSSGDEDDSPSETASKLMSKNTRKRDEGVRMVHSYLGKGINETRKFSKDSKLLLTRIANIARQEYRSSAKKRLKHVEWAAKTLNPAAFTPYVRLLGVDEQMQNLLSQVERNKEPAKEKPSEASILKSLRHMSERQKYQELRRLASEMEGESKEACVKFNTLALTLLDDARRTKFERFVKEQPSEHCKMEKQLLMRRPLAELPFNTVERELVMRLLSLLMRILESVARRPWPQFSRCERKDRLRNKEVSRVRHAMERDEHLLDELRGRIELGWPDYNRTPYAGGLSNKVLIKKVRALQKEVLGIALLPSKAYILHIIGIVNRVYPNEERPSAKKNHAMSAKLEKKFQQQPRLMKLYDDWRATNPSDSDRLVEFAKKEGRQRKQTS
jgi:hypothetical protein